MVTTSVEDFRFTILDYFIFGLMIALSAAIGIYFGYFRKTPEPNDDPNAPVEPTTGEKNKKANFGSHNLNEYLLGSRKMHAFPVAMSLVASYVSAVTVIGTPAEIYNYGTQYWLIIVPIFLMGIIVSKVYLPVYHVLGLTSSYQYLALRFHPHMTTLAAVLFLIDELFFLPIIVYGPALAFNQVTGANIHLITLIVCFTCAIYTLIGGMKAVISTDAWQTVVMCLAIFVIVIFGIVYQGGLKSVFATNYHENRIEFFNFSPSLYERNTFWSIMIGGTSYWVSFNAVNQTMVQRYMSLPNLKKAQISVVIFVGTLIMFVSLCCFVGLLIHAYYSKCDPLSVGLIQESDQLFPLYVMQVLGHLTGMSGIFMAGVVGAALSSLSVVLNSTAAILYEDIIKGFLKIQITPKNAGKLVKLIILILAVITFLLVFVIEKLGAILRTATSFSSIAASTTFGLFTLGMLIPWSNAKGALGGGIAGFIITGWIAFGTQVVEYQKLLPSQRLPVRTDGCEGNFTIVTTSTPNGYVFPLYRLSYFWISPIGIATVLIVGTIVSFITGPTDIKKLDRELISPVLHRFLPKRGNEEENTIPLDEKIRKK